MASKNKGFGDSVALSMESIINNEGYQRIFAKPEVKVATASASEPKKNAAQEALEALLATSDLLDNMGLSKSAASVLSAANDLVQEISKQAHDVGDLEVVLSDLPEEAPSEEAQELEDLASLEQMLSEQGV